MKNLYAAFILLLCCFANAQIINFPDANFKAKLLQPNVAYDEFGENITIDANNDGEIEVSEAQLVFDLDVSNANISDLTGISYFTTMKYLTCNNNLLTTISISDDVSLSGLNASHNALTSLLVNLQAMDYILNLSYNNFTSFTIESSTYYDTIDLSHNQLSSLIIENASIDYLYIDHNNLSSIEVPGMVTVYFTANFRNNQFSLLDLTHFNFYNECTVGLGNNAVDKVIFGSQPGNIGYSSDNTFADFGNFTAITSCEPENQGSLSVASCPNLEYFILKIGFNHTTIICNEGGTIFDNPALNLYINNCPNLSFICVDEGEKSSIEARINYLGLQNQVEVNSYCTFTPGGTYYTVNGATHFDYDADGCDPDDFSVPYQKFTITNGSQSGTVISDESGNYAVYVGAGTHTITPVIENPAYFTASSVSVNFPADTNPNIQNFCLATSGVHPDLEISLIPINPARPGFDANYKLAYTNKGNQVQSGTVNLAYDDAILDLVSSTPVNTSQAANTITWNFIDLQPFENREIMLVLNVNSPTETPAVSGGDVLTYAASVTSTQTDETPADNTSSLNQTVVNSFDPNDKTCLEGTIVGPEMIGQFMHYVIRFENTGTANAQNVVVKDMIDMAKFDISTLVPLAGSHPFTTRITETNKVEFLFENINLPFDDASNDGYVAFKIKTKPTLIVGDTFSNTASIYFDYNFPIVTNTATTAIQLLGNPDFEFTDAFTLYPNPTQNSLNIQSKIGVEVKSVSIFNLLGQLIQTETGSVSTIDISKLQTGQYFLKVYSDAGNAVTKFIKQ